MERTRYLIIIPVLLLGFAGNGTNYKAEIYHAYIRNDMGKWKQIIDNMEREKGRGSNFILELVNYQYGYIGWCIANKKKREAKKYLHLADKNIRLLENNNDNVLSSCTNSYKSALYGFEIKINVLKIPFLGHKSVKHAELAVQLDTTNPQAYIQYGNSLYYRPSFVGGSKVLAIEYYRKAEKLMELQKNGINNDWNYLNLLAVIGRAYEATGNDKAAKACYEKILRIEPGFLWVKNELYPQILNKIP